ncbi:MAG: hypothetical protein JWM56_64 [Candidatus Peribacteria bacterium]|nr:hypothetical protein [Candidatus Peribacteria bacterium]
MHWNEFASSLGYLHADDKKRVQKAFELGEHMHKDQKRKSGEPYFTHPIAVAEKLTHVAADADTLIAALLHDTVEDTPLTLKEIDKAFNGHVAMLIDGVTKLYDEDMAEHSSMNEQIETLRKIFSLMEKDVRIMIIKLYDRLHNMETIEFLSPEKQRIMAQETMDVYVKIADRLSMQSVFLEMEELCTAVLEPEELKQLLALRDKLERRAQTVTKAIRQYMTEEFPAMGPKFDLHYEDQRFDKLRPQLNAEGSAITGIADIAIVFECDTVDECYQCLGMLHQLWPREMLSFQDYINGPLINGYKALHTTIILSDGTRVRCKIRTHEMQEYTEKGVTLFCFNHKALGVKEYLSWTLRISPLAKDTKGSSNDFWGSLQSDILGETMLIHGPGDKTMQVPKESTALDAALYLLQEEGLRISSIRVNGKEVPFYTSLNQADSLEVTFNRHQTVNREWLQWVHTAFASAEIRNALSSKSINKKLLLGRDILQEILLDQKQGYIEEFDKAKLETSLQTIGLETLDDTFIAIADGRIDPQKVANTFGRKKNSKQSKPLKWEVSFPIPKEKQDLPNDMNKIYQKYSHRILNLYIQLKPLSRPGRGKIEVLLTRDEQLLFYKELQYLGLNVKMKISSSSAIINVFAVIILLILWGLDPIFAKKILMTDITPEYFAVIRAWSTAIFAAAIFFFMNRNNQLSRIPLRQPSLWVAGVTLFFVNILTYVALDHTSPSIYNGILRATAVILISPLLIRKRSVASFSASWALTIAGLGILFFSGYDQLGIVLSICVLGMFAIYTAASNKFQKEARIHARYTQFFFYTSLTAAITSTPLLFVLRSSIPSFNIIVLTSLFSVFFVGLPYVLFYYLTQQLSYQGVSRSINAAAIITCIADGIIFGWAGMGPVIMAITLLIGGNLIAVNQKEA